jgi:hypothetical protein
MYESFLLGFTEGYGSGLAKYQYEVYSDMKGSAWWRDKFPAEAIEFDETIHELKLSIDGFWTYLHHEAVLSRRLESAIE